MLPARLRSVLAIAVAAVLAGCDDPVPPQPPGPPAELLGAPFTERSPYSRNVWDMQLFAGRIHLAHGDMIRNAGPVTLWTLDPATGALSPGFRTDEDQVDAFRVLGGELYVPGHDPRSGWSLGNFYRLEREGWARHRTVPRAIHTFDLALHRGLLFAATGGRGKPGHPTLLASPDRGRGWTPVTDEVRRMLVLFELRGDLYAAPKLRTDGDPSAGALMRFDGTRFVGTEIGGDVLLPGLPDTAGRIVRPVGFGGALVYVVASGSINWKPAALAVTHTLRDARAVPLPDPAAVPYDLLIRGDTLYVLASAPTPSGYTIAVYATGDLARWRELFRFSSPTFARSFEESGGDFFFGLGSTYQSPSPATGAILRVRRAAYLSRSR